MSKAVQCNLVYAVQSCSVRVKPEFIVLKNLPICITSISGISLNYPIIIMIPKSLPNTVYTVYLAVILIWQFDDFSSVRQI